MSDDMDWLSDLIPNREDEDTGGSPPSPVVLSEPATPVAEPIVASLPEPSSTPSVPAVEMDLAGDLRGEMMIADEEDEAVVERSPRVQFSFGGLQPAQLFFLSVLLFLDIAVIGLLFLVMFGRIVLPI